MNKPTEAHPFMLTVERIMAMLPKMTGAEREALALWEREHLDGATVGTTDWPGWRSVVKRLSH